MGVVMCIPQGQSTASVYNHYATKFSLALLLVSCVHVYMSVIGFCDMVTLWHTIIILLKL